MGKEHNSINSSMVKHMFRRKEGVPGAREPEKGLGEEDRSLRTGRKPVLP